MLVAEAHRTQIRATACQADEPELHSSSVMSKPFRTPGLTGPGCLEGGLGVARRVGDRCLQERSKAYKVFHLLPFMEGMRDTRPSPSLLLLPLPSFPPQPTPLRAPCLSLLLRGGVSVKSACFPEGCGGSESEPWEEY